MTTMSIVMSPEEEDFFADPPLRRTQSDGFHSSASTSRINDAILHDVYKYPVHIVPDSLSSSAPSSPQALHMDSMSHSYSSTPATNFSFDGSYVADIHKHSHVPVALPSYDTPFFHCLDDDEELEPPASPRTDNSYTVSDTISDIVSDIASESEDIASPAEPESVDTSRPVSPVCAEHAEDDTAARTHPTQHVDYLSHNWKEEDIWSSWRYIVSKRSEFSNSARLENASWRTWTKAKYNLGTISPETLNWLKDCDVTWLYGPLQPSSFRLYPKCAGHGSATSRCNSFMHKKPILKKRSMSEIMLQKSLSSSSLLKQATAAIQAQRNAKSYYPGLPQRPTPADFISPPLVSRGSAMLTSVDPSSTTSGVISPSAERKHIHFNEQVKQCIAVDIKDDEDDCGPSPRRVRYGEKWADDSDSDDGAIMMKRTRSKRPSMPRKKAAFPQRRESKTIAMLPSTTLKYKADSPDSQDTAMKHGGIYGNTSASSSQETISPEIGSGYLGYEADHDGDAFTASKIEDADPLGPTPMPSPVETATQFRPIKPPQTPSNSYDNSIKVSHNVPASPAGMRRTDSGMFMPYEEGENDEANDGIIGRMIDTVNTARDIAHVIWNVGWRR